MKTKGAFSNARVSHRVGPAGLARIVVAAAFALVPLSATAQRAPVAADSLDSLVQQERVPGTSEGTAIDRDGRIRVQLSAQRQTTLSAEIAAKISVLNLRDGDSFERGQALVDFDCSWFAAQLNKAQATAEAARQTARVNRRLGELNAISALEIDQSEAKFKEAEAEAAAMRVTVEKCAVVAPFSGRVAKVHAEAYQYVTQGKPLLDILDSSVLEVKMLVPSRWLTWLAVGARFSIRIDDLGRSYPVRVTRLGARIDPVSQTVSLAGEIEGRRPELLPGMSGWASFPRPR